MRVRIVLALAIAVVAVALSIDMSGGAQRIAGTDHVNPLAFPVAVPSRGVLCQPNIFLPADAHTAEVLIGTYGHPVPRLRAWFVGPRSERVSTGALAAGAREGYVQIPLSYPHGPTVEGALCIAVGAAVHPVVLGGEAFTAGPASEQVDRAPQPGRLDVLYRRGTRESWWRMLPVLAKRFAFGKSSLFGAWTLLALALALLGVWIAALRLLVRELT